MHIFDVPWINHEGSAIFSVDFHPHGKKLATAGQESSGAGLLVIWPIEFIYKNVMQCNPNNYGFLARIPHSKSINCVRWCKDGKRLVCAGDDPIICVYKFVGNFASLGTLGGKSSKSKTLENYRCIHMLYGHSMDILHVDWSPDSKYLASCSLDNSIIVWNAQNFPEKVVTLKNTNGGHSRGVKGLSWDPIGRFLSTQAEDNTLKLWQTDSWECVHTIVEPFHESTGSTLFLRMDWSPDGSYLICPGAMNNGGPTANVIVRKDWSHTRNLVGFRKAVSCVRANSRCFRRMNSFGQSLTVSCFATGCRNRSLAIWLIPSVGRPLVVLEKFFKLSILDLSWNDLTLAACSNDGSLKIITFNESEIGEALSSGEMVSLSEKIYGFLPDVYKMDQVTPSAQSNDDIFWHNFVKHNSSNNLIKKHKFSSFEVKQMLLKTKHQKERPYYTTAENNELKNLKELDRKIFERDTMDDNLFSLYDSKHQLVAHVVQLEKSCEVERIEVFNEFFFDIFNKAKTGNNITQIIAFGALIENNEFARKKIWTVFTSYIVSHIVSNSVWTCLVTFNGRFICHSTITGRLNFSVQLNGPVCSLILNGIYCYLVLYDGTLMNWNLKRGSCSKSSLNNVFSNKKQQLALKIDPKLEVLLSDYNGFYQFQSTIEFGNVTWSSTRGIQTLFRPFENPLLNFTSFFILKEIALDSDQFFKMLNNSLVDNKETSVINNTDAGDLVDNPLIDMLKLSIKNNSESQTRFLISVLALRLLKRGEQAQKLLDAYISRGDSAFSKKMRDYLTKFLEEYTQKRKFSIYE